MHLSFGFKSENMKRYKYILLLILAFTFSSACKKSFLDVDNNSQFFRQSYVKDLSTMEQFMNGIYVMMNQYYEHGIAAAYSEITADNLKPLSSGTQLLIPQYSWTQTPTNITEYNVGSSTSTASSMNGVWTSCYVIIRACCFVMEDIDKYRNEDPDKADNIKGQALAIRAMAHFRLANVFAQNYQFSADASHLSVPYITTSDITKSYKRETTETVYKNIQADLENAIEILSNNITDTRFMNKAAAKALLSRLYLFKNDYTKAKQLAIEVCNQFPLLTIANGYPNDLFKDKKPNQSEVLYRFTPMNTSAVTNFIGRYFRGSLLRFVATTDLATALKENTSDVRNTWVTNASGLWNVTKFPSGVTPEITPAPAAAETAYYPPAIRSSEMFLTVAEASAQLGDEATARTYLDAIRKRANPTIASITATGSALIDSIYKERRKELAFEGLRMFDLQRWKVGVHRKDVLTGLPKDLNYPNDKAISPIPLQDIKLEGLEQNNGY